ncbi:hypothetical protein TL16_g07900 [Triparma laevis f. inornata]|uniref:EF-hand domain-containing protein n=1 Tax=Triparma laevis f. inornata TaxID=1714386 RepID=A0A9W7EEX5_9STRA|nr:hypothetical protein TL16_g07900 [Triparma laevis f. inornata]
MEEITFNNPSDENNAVNHLGDALGGGSDGDSETITADLSLLNKRVYAVCLIATASTGNFGDVSQLGCRIYQRFSKHRGGGMAQKEMLVTYLDLSPKEVQTQNGCVMMKLYRSTCSMQGISKSNKPPGGWLAKPALATLSCKNVDDCVPMSQRNLRDVIPSIIVRGEELPITCVNDIIAFIHPVTLAYLRKHFPKNGFNPKPFVQKMSYTLFRENESLRREHQATLLIGMLFKLFQQIDVHGTGTVGWGEFTGFCVEAGMTLDDMEHKQCGADVEYTYKNSERWQSAGFKFNKVEIWEDVNKVCMVEERSSKVRLLDKRTGTLCNVIDVQRKEAFDKEQVEVKDGNAYTSVMDVTHFVHKSSNTIAIASSDYSISFWRYEPHKKLVMWMNQINCEFVQRGLLYVPPSQHSPASMWSVGTDLTISMWDLDTKKRLHHADHGHKDTITRMMHVPNLQLAASASIDHLVKFWDIENVRPRGKPLDHGEPVKDMSCTREKLLTCGPCTVLIWEFQCMSEVCRLSTVGGNITFIKAMIVHFDDLVLGPQLRALTCGTDGIFKIWKIVNMSGDGKGEVMSSFESKPTLGRALDFASCAASGGVGCWPDLYITGGGRETQMFHTRRVRKPHVTMTNSIHSFSSMGIVTVVHKDLLFWDIMSGKETIEIKNASTHEITMIAMDVPLQRKLYVGNSNGKVSIFNAFTGSKISEQGVHGGAIASIMVCEISKHVITTSADKCIKVFVEECGELVELRFITSAHETAIAHSAYSPQQSLIATVAGEEVKLWDFQDLQLQDHLDLHATEVTMQSLIATVAGEEVKLWDFQDLQLQDHLDLHATEVTMVSFVPNLPLLITADIQGRILVWKVTSRAAMSAASCKCLVSCVLSTDEIFHNVRNMSVYMDPSDPDSEGMPLSLIATDFAGIIAFWKFEDILECSKERVEMLKPSDCANFDEEAYNPNLRYKKDGVYAQSKRNNSAWPEITVPSATHWTAHEEPILSMSPLRGAPMVVTTAADCKLRLWAAKDCKLGIRECKVGELFGEIDSMDYEEQRFERLEHWNCPNVQSLEEKEEYETLVNEALDVIVAEEDPNSHAAAMRKASVQIPLELLMGGQGSPQRDRVVSMNDSPSHQRQTSMRGGSMRGRDTRGRTQLIKPLSEQKRRIRKALMSIRADKPSRRMTQKRASMIVVAKTHDQDSMADLFDDGSDLKEIERLKKLQIRRIVESMRQTLVSANNSKTRDGKVIYGNLYGEMKQKNRKDGIVFSETDTSLSGFLGQKFEEDKVKKKLKREEEEEKRAKVRKLKVKYDYATKEGKQRITEMASVERFARKSAAWKGGGPAIDLDEDDSEEEEEEEQTLDSFFMTEHRPVTPQKIYNLGEEYESSIDENSVSSSIGTTFTKRDETVAESLGRIDDRQLEIMEKIRREENIVRFKKMRHRKAKAELKSPTKRVTLIYRQKELADKTASKMTEQKRESIACMERKTIASSSHFGTYARAEVMELAELLYTMDMDNDGEIQATEFEYYIKHGEYGDTFKHLQFEVMDVDKSGEITVGEIVNLVFHKANRQDKSRIRIAIDEVVKKRVEAAERHKNTKPKFRRVSTVEWASAQELFNYFDVKSKGICKIDTLCDLLMKEESFRHIIKENDIQAMLAGYSTEGKRDYIDIDGWLQFTLGFKGPFEIFDFRNLRVVERRNDGGVMEA